MALEQGGEERLSDQEVERYSRQLILDGVGEAGQRKLAEARVLVVGAGALGAPVIQYLAGAGVGRLEIWDGDRVELSNLARQPVHGDDDLGSSKAESATRAARRINGAVDVVAVSRRMQAEEVGAVVIPQTVVCDATDDFEIKFALNDACVAAGVPLVHAAILEYGGQLTSVVPGGPCLRCLFGAPPAPGEVPTCAQAGILGPVAAVVGGMQAVETLKLVLGVGEPLSGRLLVYDALRPRARTVDFPIDLSCAAPHPRRPANQQELQQI
ncbi:MAG: SAMP-activating enzyme [Chloroflexota bacterium]|jgi:adenylyltransferase/sulfurtransferase|nr:SAMP-activating enzyme [Chloroflexota bacterium]